MSEKHLHSIRFIAKGSTVIVLALAALGSSISVTLADGAPPPPTCKSVQHGGYKGGFYHYELFTKYERRLGYADADDGEIHTIHVYNVQIPNIPAGMVPFGQVEKVCGVRHYPRPRGVRRYQK